MDANKIKSFVHMYINCQEVGAKFTVKDLRENMGIDGALFVYVKQELLKLAEDGVVKEHYSYGAQATTYAVVKAIANPYIYTAQIGNKYEAVFPGNGKTTSALSLKEKLAGLIQPKTLKDYTDDELIAELTRRVA